jgi:hypothetical protein
MQSPERAKITGMSSRSLLASLASLVAIVSGGIGSASAQSISLMLDDRFYISSDLVWERGDLYLLGNESHNVLERQRVGGWREIANLSDGLDHPAAMTVAPDGSLYILQNAWTVLHSTPTGPFDAIDFGIAGSTLYGNDIALDSQGNLYLSLSDAVTTAGRVRKRSPGGALTDILTGEGLGGLPLLGAYAVALDSSGDAIVAGEHSDDAFRVTPAGVATQIIDAGGDGVGGTLDRPVAVAADASGNFYVVGGDSVNALRITPGGAVSEIIDATGDGLGNPLTAALGIAAGPSGNVYLRGQDNAFEITPGGVVTEILDATGDGLGNTFSSSTTPGGITVDGSDNVFVAGFASDNVFRIAPGGAVTEILDATGDGLGNPLNGPRQLATDAAGNVYVTGWHSRNVFKVAPGGVVTEWMDSPNVAEVFQPLAIASDAAGTVLVATRFSPSRVYEISPGGVESVRFDADVAGLSFLEFIPGESMALRTSGEALLPGTSGNTVIEIESSGAFTTLIDVTGDGTGQPLAFPTSLEIDAADNLYVTGGHSHNAFRITPSGTITEIISAKGDGAGGTLRYPVALDVDGSGAVYIAAAASENAFKVVLGGPVVEILDATGDDQGNGLTFPIDIAASDAGDAYVLGTESHNLIHVAPNGAATEILKGGEGGPEDLLLYPSQVVLADNDVDVYVADDYRVFRFGPADLPAVGPAALVWLTAGLALLGGRALSRAR